MSSSSIQAVRQKFQRRFISLKEAGSESLRPQLSQFKSFLNDEPVLRQIREDLINQFPNLSDKVQYVFISLDDGTNGESDLESTAIALEVIFNLAETERGEFKRKLQVSVSPVEVVIGQLRTQIEIDGHYTKVFKSIYLDKISNFIEDRLDEIEAVKNMTSNYEELEYGILKLLVEKGRSTHSNISELAEILSASKEDLNVILVDFRSKGWVGLIAGGLVQLNPSGITAFHKWETANLSSGGRIGDTYHNSFHGAVGGIQQGGRDNIQNINQNINPDFAEAVEALNDLIIESNLSELDKEDRLAEVGRIQQLAAKELTPEVIERAKSKINFLETGLKFGDLAIKAAPLIEKIVGAFGG